jgi:diguanylate cyclase (GGDEF)-like protein
MISFQLFSQVDKTDDFYFSTIDEEIIALIDKANQIGESDPSEMLRLSLDAYSMAVAEDSFENQVKALAAIGIAYFDLQEIEKSFQALDDSNQLAKRINYIEGQWYSAYHLGILNNFIDDLEKSILYFEEAESLIPDFNDPKHIPVYRELADLYDRQNQFEKAVDFSEKALKIAIFQGDLESVLSIYLLSGEIHFRAGNIRTANNQFGAIVNQTTSFGDFQNIRALAMSQMGKCYALLGDFHLALANGQNSLLLSAKNDFLEGRVKAYDSLAFIYQKMDDFKQAFENLQLYYSFKSIFDLKINTEKLNKIKAYYGTFEKEQEIDKQQIQIQSQNRLILFGSLMIAIFTILILILFLLYRKNSRIAVKLNRELKNEMFLSRTDLVTGLPNRKNIEDLIQKEIIKWKKSNTEFSIVFVSIELYRKIDKEYGEGTGQALQKFISRLLKTELKGQDIVSVWKPFLFLLLLPATNSEDSQSVVNRIKLRISREIFTKDDKEIPLSIKIGSFTYSGEGNRSDCIEKCRSELTDY